MKPDRLTSRSVIQRLLAMALFLSMTLGAVVPADAVRIKDIVNIKGVRENQLVGYGLIVGLEGTGDGKKSQFTIQSLANMLDRLGIRVDPKLLAIDNVAAVMATANLPPFARAGSRIDVLVSSIGDATNLQGGTLLMTPLMAGNGQVYAVAQGPVSTGGFQAAGAGAGVQKNFPTVGRVVSGALIEREIPLDFLAKTSVSLALQQPDFTTATRIADAINTAFEGQPAKTLDAGTIDIRIPDTYSGRIVAFVTALESLSVTPDTAARVIINERTGTVVMGENVRISTVAIAHGNLSIEIKESRDVSQPLPFSSGQTVVTPDTRISVTEDANGLFVVESGVSIGDVVRALNALGLTPRDLIAILQAIKASGALTADLDII